jgi:hypothetical protein
MWEMVYKKYKGKRNDERKSKRRKKKKKKKTEVYSLRMVLFLKEISCLPHIS